MNMPIVLISTGLGTLSSSCHNHVCGKERLNTQRVNTPASDGCRVSHVPARMGETCKTLPGDTNTGSHDSHNPSGERPCSNG